MLCAEMSLDKYAAPLKNGRGRKKRQYHIICIVNISKCKCVFSPLIGDHKHAGFYGIQLKNSSHKLHAVQFLCFPSEVYFLLCLVIKSEQKDCIMECITEQHWLHRGVTGVTAQCLAWGDLSALRWVWALLPSPYLGASLEASSAETWCPRSSEVQSSSGLSPALCSAVWAQSGPGASGDCSLWP